MEQTVLSTVRQFEAAAEEQNLTISVDTIGDVPWVQADGVKIGRVINSLISNAVKFAPRGGSVQVEISLADNPADLPAHAPTDVMTPAVVVQVIDDGAGVPETDAEAIFEPFHRAKNASAKQVEGAGLGLAVSRSLIDLHRGDIWAQPVSKKSTGGRFVFTLPLSTTL
ncbi:MAG: ATP-binding protein [Chloroflexota bacterium]